MGSSGGTSELRRVMDFCPVPGNVELADNESPAGEASLIAMKGSLLGLGTDIGL